VLNVQRREQSGELGYDCIGVRLGEEACVASDVRVVCRDLLLLTLVCA